jgi:hypothetical protein
MVWCRFSGVYSVGLLTMIEHYQKRAEASRYLVSPSGMVETPHLEAKS